MQLKPQFDKEFAPQLDEDLGKIGIRVVVFAKKDAEKVSAKDDDDLPQDLDEDEDFGTKSEVNGYLESPKRGKLCCVFLVNGQRHDGLDNGFIVNDLKMKYLRKRMVIVVDLDGLSSTAFAEAVTGSRNGLYKGDAYNKIRERLIATLQGDPDLNALEEEAEEELAQLQSGDEVVQQALDELIDQHFDLADRTVGGADASGGKQGKFYDHEGNAVDLDVIVFGESGAPVMGPVLVSDHAASSVRLVPNSSKTLTVQVLPQQDASRLKQIEAFMEPEIPGLSVELVRDATETTVEIAFDEPVDFNAEEYPLEATLSVMATFQDEQDVRLLEKNITVRPRKPLPPRVPRELNDVPTYIKVASRQPVRLIAGGPDTHVRLSWDGKDSLAFEPNPEWTFEASCKSHPQFPAISFTKPTNGKLEALLQTPAVYLVETKLEFEISAKCTDGVTMTTRFAAEVVAPPGPRKTTAEIPLRGQRRPPYKLVYINEDQFDSGTRWGTDKWDNSHAGAFVEPTDGSPLTLCINQDFAPLRKYIEDEVAGKSDEKRLGEKKTKFASHIAYHLYQMYLYKAELQKNKTASEQPEEVHEPQDDEMQLEINRVASTLIRLMEVMR